MIKSFNLTLSIIIIINNFLIIGRLPAQFLDNFDSPSVKLDPSANNGWMFYTGDGSATMDCQQGDGYAAILVDATGDQRNVWWALIRRRVSANFDLSQLSKSNFEFRIEARIRVSHAPRRVNLHLNTQRTTNFHSHLMEFDIPDTTNWHTISMTTHNFDAKPGDNVYGQLALMDWGLEKYRVDMDYFKVDIVNIDTIGSDKGVQVPYHPPISELKTFTHQIKVAQDGMIDLEYPDINFNNWYTQHDRESIDLLTVSGTQFVIMRWDFTEFAGKQVAGAGLLELTTYAVQRSSIKQKDFGMVRVVEILGGDPDWDQTDVTFNTFCQGQSLNKVINSQMIIDIKVNEIRDTSNYITISNPVLQRMIDGKTLGIAIRPLGAINASFYSMENKNGNFSARLHFNVDNNSK
ncbi:MAG: hypothetical protein JSW07_21635 [bacterium]|nr:MAG: hypothetical protein JSW07_21635 [bacterium]